MIALVLQSIGSNCWNMNASSHSNGEMRHGLCMANTSQFSTIAQRNENARRAFVDGNGGRIWLQHVRKAGGTTLCHFFGTKGNAHATPEQTCWGLPGVRQVSEQDILAKVVRHMDEKGLDFMASENGDFPEFARIGMTDDSMQNWTFLTILRHPIDLLISHAVYDLDFKLLRSDGDIDISKLSHAVTGIANGTTPIPISQGCRFDNYITRVFSSSCLRPIKLYPKHFGLALATLASFEFVFVLEWLTEMLPITKYALGMQTFHVDVRNRNTGGKPYRFSSAKWKPSNRLDATKREQGASTALRHKLSRETLEHLHRLIAFDMRLYYFAKHVARANVHKWLFQN